MCIKKKNAFFAFFAKNAFPSARVLQSMYPGYVHGACPKKQHRGALLPDSRRG